MEVNTRVLCWLSWKLHEDIQLYARRVRSTSTELKAQLGNDVNVTSYELIGLNKNT
jgi:hypothetical protein